MQVSCCVLCIFVNLEADFTPLDKLKIAKENVRSWQMIMCLIMEQSILHLFSHGNQRTLLCLQLRRAFTSNSRPVAVDSFSSLEVLDLYSV